MIALYMAAKFPLLHSAPCRSAGIDRWASTLCTRGSLTRSANTRSGMHHHVVMLAIRITLHTCFMSHDLSIALPNGLILKMHNHVPSCTIVRQLVHLTIGHKL